MRDLRSDELTHVYGAGGKGCYTPPKSCGKGSKSKKSKSKKCKASKSKKHSKGWC